MKCYVVDQSPKSASRRRSERAVSPLEDFSIWTQSQQHLLTLVGSCHLSLAKYLLGRTTRIHLPMFTRAKHMKTHSLRKHSLCRRNDQFYQLLFEPARKLVLAIQILFIAPAGSAFPCSKHQPPWFRLGPSGHRGHAPGSTAISAAKNPSTENLLLATNRAGGPDLPGARLHTRARWCMSFSRPAMQPLTELWTESFGHTAQPCYRRCFQRLP